MKARLDAPAADTWHGAARWAWTSLLTVQLLLAISAIGGGVGLVLTNGLGVRTDALAGSPFDSFLLPGLILLLVVGGTQVTGAILQLRGSIWYLVAAGVAGATLLIWIFVEMATLRDASALQPIVFGAGLLQLLLAGFCRGVLPDSRPERHGTFGLNDGSDSSGR